MAHGGGRRCEVMLARCVGGIREGSRGIEGGTRGYTRGLTVLRGNQMKVGRARRWRVATKRFKRRETGWGPCLV